MLKLSKKNLILFTGFIWLWACIVLLYRSYMWGQLFDKIELYILLSIGVIVAFIKTILIFRKLNLKNIERIKSINKKHISILQFHKLKDKILIVVMIVGGVLLRKSEFIHVRYLFPVYFGIGLAMLYSSILYFKSFYFSK